MEGIKERRKRNTAVFGKRESGWEKIWLFWDPKVFFSLFFALLSAAVNDISHLFSSSFLLSSRTFALPLLSPF